MNVNMISNLERQSPTRTIKVGLNGRHYLINPQSNEEKPNLARKPDLTYVQSSTRKMKRVSLVSSTQAILIASPK